MDGSSAADTSQSNGQSNTGGGALALKGTPGQAEREIGQYKQQSDRHGALLHQRLHRHQRLHVHTYGSPHFAAPAEPTPD